MTLMTMNIINMTRVMSCTSKGRMGGMERLWKMMAMILIMITDDDDDNDDNDHQPGL